MLSWWWIISAQVVFYNCWISHVKVYFMTPHALFISQVHDYVILHENFPFVLFWLMLAQLLIILLLYNLCLFYTSVNLDYCMHWAIDLSFNLLDVSLSVLKLTGWWLTCLLSDRDQLGTFVTFWRTASAGFPSMAAISDRLSCLRLCIKIHYTT